MHWFWHWFIVLKPKSWFWGTAHHGDWYKSYWCGPVAVTMCLGPKKGWTWSVYM